MFPQEPQNTESLSAGVPQLPQKAEREEVADSALGAEASAEAGLAETTAERGETSPPKNC